MNTGVEVFCPGKGCKLREVPIKVPLLEFACDDIVGEDYYKLQW